MADFSFSFDSDNPFAEPEQTPKKAIAPTDEAATGTSAPAADSGGAPPTASVANAPAPDNNEFSLDSFDFAFDEDASINDSLPTRNTPLDEVPPRKMTPGEAAFAEFNFSALEGAETPATKAPQAEAPEAEAPEVEAPQVEAPEAEAPQVEAPQAEAPEVEAPEAEALEVEVSEIETLEFKVPEVEALKVETPEAEAPEMEKLEDEAPQVSSLEEIAASTNISSRSARSDLEEFNAFTYDFGLPTDETLDDESDATASEASDDAAVATGEAPATEFSLDFLETEAPIAEPLVAEPEVAQSLIEEVEEPATPRRLSTRDAVDDAPLIDSVEADDEGEGQTEGEFRRLRTRATLNVAILGASGIGKNHARWFHHHGCHVVGFLGTSNDSTAQTEADLSAEFDFQGNAYTDLETLLQTEKPDIVCVATPPPLHFGHVLQSLEAGAHVLCEKPLVYAPTRKFRENRDGAKELVKVAARRDLNLGTQLQYGGATPILCKLAGLSPADVGDFAMEIETTNPNSPRDPRELWIDLGPHPISVAQMLAGPGARLVEETMRLEPYEDDEKTEVLARFGINCADGRLLMVRAVVRALRGENPRKPRRRFSFNGHAVTYAPLQSAKNGFQAQFVAPDGYASVYPDPVDYLIGNFVNACRNGEPPMITGDFGRENLEWMLKVGTLGEIQ